MPPLIELMNVTKTYTSGARAVTALHALSLNVADGEFVGLANDPALLLADEPTGNLDSITGAAVMEGLAQYAAQGRTLVLATHDLSLLARADRTPYLVDGRLSATNGSPISSSKKGAI